MTMTTGCTPSVAAHPRDGAIFDGTFRGAADTIAVTAPATGRVIGRFGGPGANLDTFTETQWVTMQADIERYPF
jgi:hypothetical protein